MPGHGEDRGTRDEEASESNSRPREGDTAVVRWVDSRPRSAISSCVNRQC